MDDEETFSVRATTGDSLASPSGPISVRREGSIAVSNEIDLVFDLLRLSISSSFCTLRSLVCNCVYLRRRRLDWGVSDLGTAHGLLGVFRSGNLCFLVSVQVGSSSGDHDRRSLQWATVWGETSVSSAWWSWFWFWVWLWWVLCRVEGRLILTPLAWTVMTTAVDMGIDESEIGSSVRSRWDECKRASIDQRWAQLDPTNLYYMYGCS